MIKKIIQNLFGKSGSSSAGRFGKRRVIPASTHGIDPELVDDRAWNVVRTLQERGFQAYIVGGAVRDLLVGLKPKDFDVATDATPEEVKACFRALVGWMDKSTVQPDEFNPAWEVLLLDDVQTFSAVQQHMAFNWFVNAATPGSARQPWVLAAGCVPPQDLPLREDLRTRLGWGHVFHLQLLDDDQRRDVLLKHSQALGMHLGNDLLDYLLSRFSRDLGHLIDLLEQLDNYALQTQRPLTIPLLRAMLDEI